MAEEQAVETVSLEEMRDRMISTMAERARIFVLYKIMEEWKKDFDLTDENIKNEILFYEENRYSKILNSLVENGGLEVIGEIFKDYEKVVESYKHLEELIEKSISEEEETDIKLAQKDFDFIRDAIWQKFKKSLNSNPLNLNLKYKISEKQRQSIYNTDVLPVELIYPFYLFRPNSEFVKECTYEVVECLQGLFCTLIMNGRFEDLKRALDDIEYRKELIKQYNLLANNYYLRYEE